MKLILHNVRETVHDLNQLHNNEKQQTIQKTLNETSPYKIYILCTGGISGTVSFCSEIKKEGPPQSLNHSSHRVVVPIDILNVDTISDSIRCSSFNYFNWIQYTRTLLMMIYLCICRWFINCIIKALALMDFFSWL